MHKIRKYYTGSAINYNSGVNLYLDLTAVLANIPMISTKILQEQLDKHRASMIEGVSKEAAENAESKTFIQDAKNPQPEIKNKNLGGIGFGSIAKAGRSLFDMGASALGAEKNDTMDSIYDTASDVAALFGPWGLLASGVIDTWNFLDKSLGKAFTNEKLQRGFEGLTGSSSYADFSTQGKSLRLTQLGALDRLLALRNTKAQQYAKAMSNVATNRQAVQARALAADNMNTTFYNRKSGGVSGSLLTAKNGGVLKSIKTVISKVNRGNILNSKTLQNIIIELDKEDIKMFKDGGAVIPSGALHKNKHHLEEIDESLNKNITSKGIPVITIEEGGEIKQHAEIEKEEVILSLSLTKQIEKLWKEGTDEAAIEAGKLLTEALLKDTEDNVGLIEKIENENKG